MYDCRLGVIGESKNTTIINVHSYINLTVDCEITSSGKYYIYGTGEETANETVVSGNIQVEMILDNVNVRGSTSHAYGAIRVTGGATLTLRLVGSNYLTGCYCAPGIEVSEGNTLIITSYESDGKTTGYLKAQTGLANFVNDSIQMNITRIFKSKFWLRTILSFYI